VTEKYLPHHSKPAASSFAQLSAFQGPPFQPQGLVYWKDCRMLKLQLVPPALFNSKPYQGNIFICNFAAFYATLS